MLQRPLGSAWKTFVQDPFEGCVLMLKFIIHMLTFTLHRAHHEAFRFLEKINSNVLQAVLSNCKLIAK